MKIDESPLTAGILQGRKFVYNRERIPGLEEGLSPQPKAQSEAGGRGGS